MPRYCENCGAELLYEEAEICPKCGVRIKEPTSPQKEKSPGVALLLSFLFTGSGQVYNGELLKGILFIIGTFVGMLFFFIPGLIIWIFGIYDAYSISKKMNEGEIEFKEPSALDIILYVIVWIIFVVIIIAAIIAAFIFGMAGSPYY